MAPTENEDIRTEEQKLEDAARVQPGPQSQARRAAQEAEQATKQAEAKVKNTK